MRNPRHKRNISIAITLASALSLAVAVIFYSPEHQTVMSIVGFLGLTLTILGIAYSINAQFETARYNRLIRGEGVLVEWLVDPHRWRDFLKLNESLNTRSDQLNCPIDDPTNVDLRDEGIRVVIGRESLMIDGDFHSLPLNGITRIEGPFWLEGPPQYLEFQLSSSGKSTTYHWALRIPVAAGGTAGAQTVYDHYHSRKAR